MERAITRLTLQSVPFMGGTMTDGNSFFYDPSYVADVFVSNTALMTRNYLHSLLHCLFAHQWVGINRNRDCWDLCCDIIVEDLINELEISVLDTPNTDEQKAETWQLKRLVPCFTAEHLYDYFMSHFLARYRFDKEKDLFQADSHDIWYNRNVLDKYLEDQIDDKISGGSQQLNNSPSSGLRNFNDLPEKLRDEWEKIADIVRLSKDFSQSPGKLPGSLTQNLNELTREKYDYGKFLRKFAVPVEKLKINMDEFDYIPYTYGMEIYGNIPMIEPLEYQENSAIRELVIAIDTSGSVRGKLVQLFLQKTYNILKSTESFNRTFLLHIIQCDAHIQDDVTITCQDEFDKYIKNIEIKGLGGTDFRPVFEYVDTMIRNREFKDLKGLIYFTDGYGKFPECKPDYKVAFAFVDNDKLQTPEVPPWAMKVVLSENEIREVQE